MKRFLKSGLLAFTCAVTLLAVTSTPALASGAGGPPIPWNAPLQNLLDNLSGPTAQVQRTERTCTFSCTP
jgi:type IV secretory pathway VirB2 component (pilin)